MKLGKLAKFGVVLFQSIRGPHPPACRFQPSCSRYASEAYETHSFLRATKFVVMRLMRCHPWGGWGFDPVPDPLDINSKSH